MKKHRKVEYQIFYEKNEQMYLFKGTSIFLTIGLDLVISGISEPVRFLIEAKARIREINDSSSQDISETIWSSFKKVTPFSEEFDMIIKQVNRR
jgi:hypothetical protein